MYLTQIEQFKEFDGFQALAHALKYGFGHKQKPLSRKLHAP
jgi:hypothetical protein